MFCNGVCLLSSARTGQLQVHSLFPQGAVGQGLPQHPMPASHLPPRPTPALAAQLWEQSLPQTTQRAPTGAHRPCSCRLSSPWAWPALLPHRGHGRRSCRNPVPASSSSARCGTGSPRRRSGSTRSTGWSPTSTSRESTKEHPGKGDQGHGVAGLHLHTLTQQLLMWFCSSHLSKCGADLETSFALSRQFRSQILPLFLLVRGYEVFLV